MTIYRMLQKTPLGPEDTERLVKAYKAALHEIGLKDRDDPLTQIIARKIIEVGQTGTLDPAQISRLAIKKLGLP